MERSSDTKIPVKQYLVNLDTPAAARFLPLFQDPHIQQVVLPTLKTGVEEMIKNVVPEDVRPKVDRLLKELDLILPKPFAEELRSIATFTGIDLGQLVLFNLAYELTVGCTSIVAQDKEGNIWHGRNQDYKQMTQFLRDTTITIDFQSKGKTLYTSTSFLGYVGTMTGQRPNGFTIAMQLRHQGDLWENALQALRNRDAMVMSFLVRETLAEADSYDAAVQKLANTPLIAPLYFIVSGVKPGEGAVITRDRKSAVDIWSLSPTVSGGRWYVLETNYDRWNEPPAEDNRRTPATEAIEKVGQAEINAWTMFQVMSSETVLNWRTVYTIVMSAAQPGVYKDYCFVRPWTEDKP